MLRTSAPGWFKQRCPFCDIFSTKGKYRDGTKQLYGLRPIHVPMKRRRCFLFPSRGYLETRRPRNLSVPHTGQANQQARSSKGNDGLPGAFPRNRDLDGIRSRQSQRIGSVRKRLCTWAASAGSCERNPAVTGTAANPNVRGRAFAAGESDGIEVPDIDSRAMRSLFAPQFALQLAAPGRGWFNWCCT
jgi:hypothetical protein